MGVFTRLSGNQVVLAFNAPNPSYGFVVNPSFGITTNSGIVEHQPVDLFGSDRWIRHLETIVYTLEKFENGITLYLRPARVIHQLSNGPWLSYKRDVVVEGLISEINTLLETKQQKIEVALPGTVPHKVFFETIHFLTDTYGRTKVVKEISVLSDNT